MKSILVPTDFSETSKTAARYAIHLAKQIKAEKLILFNACERYIETDPTLPVVVEDFSKNAMGASKEALEDFKNALLPLAQNLKISTHSMYGFLTDEINNVVSEFDASFIVMGVTGDSKFEETLIGSFAIDVSKVAKVPVIIVPPKAAFTPIEEVLFACDFEKFEESSALADFKKLLNETKPKLFILNTTNNGKNNETDFSNTSLLDLTFSEYNPQYFAMNRENFVDEINDFATEKEVDLIITIPKKYGFFDGLFKKNHTKLLAFHSHVPLMVLHD